MNMRKLLVLLLIAGLVAAYFAFDLGRYLSFEAIKAQQAALAARVEAAPWSSAALYFGVYVLMAAASLPGALVLTLLGGALFGFWKGLLLVSFASSIGATLAFLSARFLLRDSVQRRFGTQLAPLEEGMRREGAFYLFALRLVPLFPFFVVNLLMGLTPIRVLTFYGVSQLGMLPGTAVFVNAGTQLAGLQSAGDIVSFKLALSFALLGLFPLIARKLLAGWKARRVYRRWPRPRSFDYNLVVIGGGAAGLVSAYIAAAVKAKVVLIEKHRMGGDCLNYGCVPSKALIRSARLATEVRQAGALGLATGAPQVDFRAVMERVQRVIQAIEPHDSVERYTGLGVEVIEAEARITSPWTVQVGGRTLSTRAIVIASGAAPTVPPLPGLEQSGYLTSDTLWQLRELPRRLLVLGGGPIGCELAQAFARLGASVTQVEMLPRLLMREDEAVGQAIQAALEADGVKVLTGTAARAVEIGPDGVKRLQVARGDQTWHIEFDQLLVAVGRTPRTTGFGLEELGIPVTKQRTVETDAWLQTLYPNIYACGDVAGPYQFTHVAAHQAWYCAVNALFGTFRKFKADYSVIPAVTFTEPEVARVGLNQAEARARGIEFEVTEYGIDDLDRAIADGAAHGWVQVLTAKGKDRVLGATIVGSHAGEMLAEFTLAMRWGLGLNKILSTIHPYPTFGEANKYAAGVWKKAHAPQGLLKWVERYHAWRRG